MEDRTDATDMMLAAYFAGVDARLRAVCEAGFVLNPEDFGEQLDFAASILPPSVDALLAELEARPEPRVDLNVLVDVASRELMKSSHFPVVIRTVIEPGLPTVDVPRGTSMAVLLRVLQLCVAIAGPAAELRVVTSSLPASVGSAREETPRVMVEIDFGVPPTSGSSAGASLQAVLTDIVTRIGGAIEVAQTDHLIRLGLTFPAATPIR